MVVLVLPVLITEIALCWENGGGGFQNEKDSLWYKMLVNLYGQFFEYERNSVLINKMASPVFCGWIKNRGKPKIRELLDEAQFLRVVRNGKSTKFLLDKWFPQEVLRAIFPQLFDISCFQYFSVADMVMKLQVEGVYNVRWWNQDVH